MTDKPIQLSEEASNELRAIAKKEIEEDMTDEEIEEMGMRLLRLFDILISQEPTLPETEVTEQEFKALRYLHHTIYHDKRVPSVRDIAEAVGLRSSRSGFKLLNRLIDRDFVYRDEKGQLQLNEKVGDCGAKFVCEGI